MEALFLVRDRVEQAQWYRMLGFHWSRCDDIGRFASSLRRILKSADSRYIDLMMTDDERAARDALPQTFDGWRGCYDNNRLGLSYSLDRRVAEEFPFLDRYRQSGSPLLVKARIRRSGAVLKLGRGEREIVAIDRYITETIRLEGPPMPRPYMVVYRSASGNDIPWREFFDAAAAEIEAERSRAQGREFRVMRRDEWEKARAGPASNPTED